MLKGWTKQFQNVEYRNQLPESLLQVGKGKQLIKIHHLTFGLHGNINDDKRIDLGGGSASGTVPVVCVRPRRPWTPP